MCACQHYYGKFGVDCELQISIVRLRLRLEFNAKHVDQVINVMQYVHTYSTETARVETYRRRS